MAPPQISWQDLVSTLLVGSCTLHKGEGLQPWGAPFFPGLLCTTSAVGVPGLILVENHTPEVLREAQ